LISSSLSGTRKEMVHDSPLCFQADVQTIDRKRKKTTAHQKKDKVEENARKVGKLNKAMATVKKSVLAPTQVLVLFPKQGFVITGT
jgi:lipid-binding SYLF domain-containing protein